MKRGKKILTNTIIMIVLLSVTYYFGGFYFSKEACAKDCLKANYQGNGKVMFNLEVDNTIYTICEGKEENLYAIIRLEKIGFLYRSIGLDGVYKTWGKELLDIRGWASNEEGQVIFIQRNNPEIATIEVDFEDGRNLVLNEWSHDFTSYHLDLEDGLWLRGNYQCYDETGQLVGEMKY